MLSEKRHLLFPFSKFRLFLVNPTLFTFRITTISIIREASPLNAKDNSVFWIPPIKLPNNRCHMTPPTFIFLCSLQHDDSKRDILLQWCLFRKEVSEGQMNQEYSPRVWV